MVLLAVLQAVLHQKLPVFLVVYQVEGLADLI